MTRITYVGCVVVKEGMYCVWLDAMSILTKSICVYHHGDHTCPAKPVAQKPVREIKQQLTENPRLTPSTIQSNLIVPQMRQGIKIALF